MEDWPPGFRFYPTEEELVSFYLHNKLEGRREDLNRLMDQVIPVVDIYEYNPEDLPQFSENLCHKDPEQWFFFVPRQESEVRGGRPRRLTETGYWKATGSPGVVYASSNTNRPVGGKRTMVFYQGRAPRGRKTEWKMNEYKSIQGEEAAIPSSSTSAAPIKLRQEFSLCRVYKKSKCLRSFDRRPPPGMITRELPMTAQQAHGNYEATTSQTHHPQMVERKSSAESSSSGDHGNPSQNGETSNTTMAVDDAEAFWDWELDWFCGNGMN